jgi:hypothetical protein
VFKSSLSFVVAIFMAGAAHAQVSADPHAVAPVVYSGGPQLNVQNCNTNDPAYGDGCVANDGPVIDDRAPADYGYAPDYVPDYYADAPVYSTAPVYLGISLLPDSYYWGWPYYGYGYGYASYWPFYGYGCCWPYYGYGGYWGGAYWAGGYWGGHNHDHHGGGDWGHGGGDGHGDWGHGGGGHGGHSGGYADQNAGTGGAGGAGGGGRYGHGNQPVGSGAGDFSRAGTSTGADFSHAGTSPDNRNTFAGTQAGAQAARGERSPRRRTRSAAQTQTVSPAAQRCRQRPTPPQRAAARQARMR